MKDSLIDAQPDGTHRSGTRRKLGVKRIAHSLAESAIATAVSIPLPLYLLSNCHLPLFPPL
jgi:hypothetical protein